MTGTSWSAEALPGIDEELRIPERAEGMSLQERFERFHDFNPHVYVALRRLARDLVEAGRGRIGIGMLTEVLRWQSSLMTVGEPWKINNSYRAFYARLLMEREPEFAGVFETRVSEADVAD